jgi:methylmalonyl-CoA/ethylmalonyl-CoA epimerase
MGFAMAAPFDQVGHVVADLDAAIARRLALSGLGPWMVFRHVVLEGTLRGEPVTVAIDVGLAWRGDTQIELIAPCGAGPSPYRRADGGLALGLHHLAWIVPDLDATVAEAEARGLVPVFSACNPATRVCYLEDLGEPGMLYEFIEGPGIADLHRAGIASAAGWDGAEPVREVA